MTNECADFKKVLILLGSPRKGGNSTVLAEQIRKGAEAEGAEAETVRLNALHIRPCQACYTCQAEDRPGCKVEDDMQALYPKLIRCGSWVIASPVYWFSMSAQTKAFMDRCYALFCRDEEKSRLRGKRIAIAMSYGDADPFVSGCVNALHSFQDAYRYAGAEIVGMVYGSADEPGEIRANQALMQAAWDLGRALART